jgi:hypothetical protein
MQILEMNEEGKTVADLTHLEGVGPHVKVMEQGAAKGKDVVVKLGETEATLVSAEYSDASAEVNVTDPPARPSLDVAIETLGHLRPRIEALCLRMLGWDKREMGAELRTAFEESVDRFEANAATLATALELLRNKGFVAKTTDKTRKLASMRKPGTPVKLDPALVVDYAEMYSADELAALEVVRTVGSKVFLKTGAREVGLVDVTKVEVKS